jgi:hypothetical protein
MKELEVNKEILKAAQDAVKGAIGACQILRDDGSFYRKRQYEMTEAEWADRILKCMQTLAMAAVDAVLFKVFLMEIDAAMDKREKKNIGSLLEKWDLFRAKVALGEKAKGGENGKENAPAEGQDEGDVQGQEGAKEPGATDPEPTVGN